MVEKFMSRQIRIWSFGDVDRSGKVRWTAEELGYDIEESRLQLGEQAADPYRQMNPYEQIPTAELGGEILIESTAICMILAERHPEQGLIPSPGRMRDLFWQSINVSTNTLEMPVVMYFLSKLEVVDPGLAQILRGPLAQRLEIFSAQVPADGYICGEFTLTDICAAYCLRIGVQAGLLSFEGELERYLRRLMDRPAAVAARFFDSLEV
jgi:glutathione S-transferase